MTVWRTASPASRSLHAALLAVGVLAALLGVVELALFGTSGADLVWLRALFTLIGLVYVAAGVVAWWRRPSNRIGRIIVLGGYMLLACALVNTPVPVLGAIGTVLQTFPLALPVWLLLAFPSGRLADPLSRAVVAAGFVVAGLFQAPQYVFDPAASPDGLLAAGSVPAVVSAVARLQQVAGCAVMLVTIGILVTRLRRATRPQRRVAMSLYGYGVVALLTAILAPNVLQPALHLSEPTRALLQLVAIGGIPVAFAFGVLTGGFARTSELQELGEWLAAPAADRPAIVDALSRTLGDRSVELAYWSAGQGRMVDEHGRPLPDPTPQREQVAVESVDGVVGAIVYDPSLNADPELVRAAGRVVALAIDRDRLTAGLRASHHALQVSRARLVAAADRERQRIAQDLHDGMQAQLVAIALHAQQLATLPDAPPTLAAAATQLRVHVDRAARELRELVHQIMPAALIERGLCAALEDLADRMPVPTRFHATGVDPAAIPDPVQRTGYFIVAEALTNAVRHAHATRIDVALCGADGQLDIRISDDGVGGARINAGLGLRGLADRVDVHGGRLRIDSVPGQGTRLVAELPCVS